MSKQFYSIQYLYITKCVSPIPTIELIEKYDFLQGHITSEAKKLSVVFSVYSYFEAIKFKE